MCLLSYDLLRSSLLQSKKENIGRSLQSVENTWREKGVSIISAGWSEERPSINFMAITKG